MEGSRNAVEIGAKRKLRMGRIKRRRTLSDQEKGGAMSAGMDYRSYRLKKSDIAGYVGKSLALSVLISWLFYQSMVGLSLFLVICPVGIFLAKKERAKLRRDKLREQFQECIRVVSASMQVGYSVENAFGEAERELEQLLGSGADMCRELHRINRKIKLNIPIEALLEDLANRSGVEEIFSFGQVFGYAKRNGGDFARILRDTSERIGEKTELEQEIRTMIAGKQLEQKIMNLVPLGILFFIEQTSPEFLEMMYVGFFGRICMTICLLLYGGAYLLSRRIVDIRI